MKRRDLARPTGVEYETDSEDEEEQADAVEGDVSASPAAICPQDC